MEILRELSLFGLNVAAIVALGRLFSGSDHLGPLFAQAVLAHLTLLALRRTGRSLLVSALVTPVVAFIATMLVFYPGSTLAGIPTSESFDLLWTDLDTAIGLFGEAPTPTEPLTGFLVLCAVALWIAAFVADWAAFRLRVPTETLLPSATIFVFAAVLADGEGRTLSTTVALVAAMVFLLVHRTARQAGTATWVNAAAGRANPTLLGSGAVLVLLAVVAASLVGPNLPGAGSDPIVDLEPSNETPKSRVTVSPLVDIRRRLVDQADVEVFRVSSDTRAYWRLTSLDSFDGRIWSSSGSYGRAKGDLDPPIESAPDSESTTQSYVINALAAIWLPAAYEPRSVDADIDLRYDDFSSTLIVDTDIPDSDGLEYTVESNLPRIDAPQLESAGSAYPQEVLDSYLDLPDDFPPSVADLARQITSGTTSRYAAAMALQDHLRTFRYDLSVPNGHSDNDLERFLLYDQAGYCEQFAGSFAAMARSLEIPARVGVGFTPGLEIEPGLYSVRGEHAHAWPELYFSGIGWVPFEPTPGRGAPGAESYTGVPEEQVQSGGDPNTATTVAPTPTTAAPPTSIPPDPAQVPVTQPAPAGEADIAPADDGGLPSWALWIAAGVGGALLLTASYAALGLYLHRRRRRQRRLTASSPAAEVQVAWTESLEDLRLLGLLDDPTATHNETITRAGQVMPAGQDEVETLGALAETAVYGATMIDEEGVEVANRSAVAIAEVVKESTTLKQRSKEKLDPRTVFGVGPFRHIGRD